LYVVNTQDRSASEVPGNVSRTAGKAMLTMVTSRKERKVASEVTASTRLGRPFWVLMSNAAYFE
jgi:hypothetical protein